MKVKKLKWVEFNSEKTKFHKLKVIYAVTPFGFYIIQSSWRGGYVWRFLETLDIYNFISGSHKKTLKEAKQAAQLEFEENVKGCIEK